MTRQNLFSDLWDEDDATTGRRRIFGRPDDARMGASLYELPPGTPGGRLHMHFGAEEMFFVLSGRPVLRTPQGEEQLAPGDYVSCPEGRAGLHTFGNPGDESVLLLALSAGGFPDVVAYPEDGYAWVATRDPDPELLARGGDPGIIARFEIPVEERKRPRERPLLVSCKGPGSGSDGRPAPALHLVRSRSDDVKPPSLARLSRAQLAHPLGERRFTPVPKGLRAPTEARPAR